MIYKKSDENTQKIIAIRRYRQMTHEKRLDCKQKSRTLFQEFETDSN